VSLIAIAGGGPAGSSAAVSAIAHGAGSLIVERSRMPRHKVCGEFLSPEISPLLERMGLSSEFSSLEPARVNRMTVRIGKREKVTRLPEPAFGLSRYEFDALLLNRAESLGAQVQTAERPCNIIATGRSASLPRGARLFGFKAHFEGPVDDAVELFFFDGCYVGINCVEQGRTNVCGLAPENILRDHAFEVDAALWHNDALARRLAPMRRVMRWLFTGPLDFGNRFGSPVPGGFLAGDALSFVDPFTGSGLVSAVATGMLAGEYAARNLSVESYLDDCRRVLARPFEISSALRWIARTRWAERLLESVPGRLLYWATRPQLANLPRLVGTSRTPPVV
jgi:menaquinone-9 beta-reductase